MMEEPTEANLGGRLGAPQIVLPIQTGRPSRVSRLREPGEPLTPLPDVAPVRTQLSVLDTRARGLLSAAERLDRHHSVGGVTRLGEAN